MQSKRRPIWKEPPFLIGIGLTCAVFVLAFVSLGLGEFCDSSGRCTSKWVVLKASPPNEIGDSLAGFAGTLAFVWLIVTVWLQATELREQREEFEKMADAQEAQVALLATQGEIFADEQRQRDESRYHGILLKQLELSRDAILMLVEKEYAAAWLANLIPLFRDEDGRRRGHTQTHRKLFDVFDNPTAVDQCFKTLLARSRKRREFFEKFIGPRVVVREVPNGIAECFDILASISDLKPSISEEDRVYLTILGVDETIENWSRILHLYGIEYA